MPRDQATIEALNEALLERRRWSALLRARGLRRPSLALFETLHHDATRAGSRVTERPQAWLAAQLRIRSRSTVYRTEYRLARHHAIVIGRLRKGPRLGSVRAIILPYLAEDGSVTLPLADLRFFSDRGYTFDTWALLPWIVHRCDAVLGQPAI